MSSRIDIARWLHGFQQLERRSRLAAKETAGDSAKAVARSLELMEIVCRLEKTPVARKRREREVAVVRELWKRAVFEERRRKAQQLSKRSPI